jgi:hypothetical protein
MVRLQIPSQPCLKKSFSWIDVAKQAFQDLKDAMCTIPILTMLNFIKPFVLEFDTLGKGIGVVLIQEG